MSATTPPVNFGLVYPGVYRSGFPTRHNLEFMKRLGLRTLVKLDASAYPDDVQEWIDQEGLHVQQCVLATNKEPFEVMDPSEIRRAIRTLKDPNAWPVMVHSLRGQSRIGVVIGCLRRMQRWTLAATFEEYRRYAGSAASLLDLQMIELHDASDAGRNDAADQGAAGDTREVVHADVTSADEMVTEDTASR